MSVVENPTTPKPEEGGASGISPDLLARARDQPTEMVGDTLRGRLQELAPSRIDMVVASLDAALQAKKSARGYCKHCDKSVVVEVNDPVAAVNAFKALLEATEGKPGQAEDVSQAGLMVRRVAASRMDTGKEQNTPSVPSAARES